MKKMLWVIWTLAVVTPAAFAQANLEAQVTREIAQSQMNQLEQQQAFLEKLGGIQQMVKDMTQYNESQVMQATVELADDFFSYVFEQAGASAKAEDLKVKPGIYLGTWAYFVDKPMVAGWTDTDFVLTRAIDDFLDKGAGCWWAGEKEKHELAMLSVVIKQYSPWRNGTQPQSRPSSQGNQSLRPAGESVGQEPVLPFSTHWRQ